MDNIQEIKNINTTLEILDRVAKAVIELSYKIKLKVIQENPKKARAELMRDIFILREAIEKDLDCMHEKLTENATADDLYAIIS